MEFKYWCPKCNKTMLREGLRLRRKSSCIDSGDTEGWIYLKGLLYVGWLILVGVIVRATYYVGLLLI